MPYLTPDEIPAASRCRSILIPDNTLILAAVNGALYELTHAHNWEQYGAVTPDEIAAAMQTMFLDYLNSECGMGQNVTEITITPAAAFPVLLKTVLSGETADEILVTVDTAFDTGTLTIGDSGDNDRLMTDTQNSLALTEQFQVSPQYKYTDTTDIYVYLAGAPTTGSARITLYSYLAD